MGGDSRGSRAPFFSDFCSSFLKVKSFEWYYCAKTPRMFMCCEYGAKLHSRKNFFRPPLSEFSGFTPALAYFTSLVSLLRDYLRWTGIPHRRSSNTPRRFKILYALYRNWVKLRLYKPLHSRLLEGLLLLGLEPLLIV